MAAAVTVLSLVALGGAWILSKGKKKSGKKKNGSTPGHREPWATPLLWDGPTLEGKATAEICRLGPLIAENLLTGSVWENLFPAIAWPVLPADHATVRSAAQLVTELVTEYLGAPATFCVTPDRPPRIDPVKPQPRPPIVPPVIPPPQPQPPKPIPIEDLEDPGNYPTPGKFYQVVYGDLFNGTNGNHSIVYRALLAAAFMAAKNIGGYDNAAAGQYARTVAESPAARAIYRDLIQCSPFNDALYGTYGYGPNASPGPHMRAIRLMAYHEDNRARLKAGAPAVRTINLGLASARGKGTATGSGNKLEYLWLPSLNLQKLWASGTLEDRITSQGLSWEDGSSQIIPPPEFKIATELLPKYSQTNQPFPFGCNN